MRASVGTNGIRIRQRIRCRIVMTCKIPPAYVQGFVRVTQGSIGIAEYVGVGRRDCGLYGIAQGLELRAAGIVRALGYPTWKVVEETFATFVPRSSVTSTVKKPVRRPDLSMAPVAMSFVPFAAPR